jgi:hypothetical protein
MLDFWILIISIVLSVFIVLFFYLIINLISKIIKDKKYNNIKYVIKKNTRDSWISYIKRYNKVFYISTKTEYKNGEEIEQKIICNIKRNKDDGLIYLKTKELKDNNIDASELEITEQPYKTENITDKLYFLVEDVIKYYFNKKSVENKEKEMLEKTNDLLKRF